MAGRKHLQLIGWAYGGLTLFVALVAGYVVTAELNSPVQASTEIARVVDVRQ